MASESHQVVRGRVYIGLLTPSGFPANQPSVPFAPQRGQSGGLRCFLPPRKPDPSCLLATRRPSSQPFSASQPHRRPVSCTRTQQQPLEGGTPGYSCGDNGGRGHTAVRAGGCGKRVKNGTSTQTQLRAGPDLASILPLPLGRWAPSKGASRGAWSALCPEKPVDTVPWAQRSLPCRTEVTVRLHRPSSRGSTGSQPGLRGRPARSGLVRPLTTPRARSLPDLAPAASGSPEVLRSSRVPINTDQGPGSAAGLLLAPRWAAHNTPHPWAWPGFSQTQGRCPRKKHGVPGPAHRRKGGTAGNSSVFPGVLAL